MTFGTILICVGCAANNSPKLDTINLKNILKIELCRERERLRQTRLTNDILCTDIIDMTK